MANTALFKLAALLIKYLEELQNCAVHRDCVVCFNSL